MWANTQRNGRPAEYRWRLLFNAAKFGWRPLQECRAVTLKTRNRWNLQGCLKLPDRSQLVNQYQPLVGRSSPYYQDMWRRYCCLTSFFPIVDTCLSCEDIARQNCAIVPNGDFLRPVFQRAACSTFQTCILNSHKGHTMCGSMVDIQSATAKIRRGKKKDRTRNVGQCQTWWPPCRIQVAPSVQRRTVWLTPTTRVPCSNEANSRNPFEFAGVPQSRQRISAANGPKFTILWGLVGRHCCLTCFFPIVDVCLSCEGIARQSCGRVCRWRFLRHFCVLYFLRAACSTFQTCILNSH